MARGSMNEKLNLLRGTKVSLAICDRNYTGFVIGILSSDHCESGDYAIESEHCQARFVFAGAAVTNIEEKLSTIIRIVS